MLVAVVYAGTGDDKETAHTGMRTPRQGGRQNNNETNFQCTQDINQLAAPIPLTCQGYAATTLSPQGRLGRHGQVRDQPTDAAEPDTQTSPDHALHVSTAPIVTFHVQGALHALTVICWIHFSGEGQALSEQDFDSALRNTALQIPVDTIFSTIQATLIQWGELKGRRRSPNLWPTSPTFCGLIQGQHAGPAIGS